MINDVVAMGRTGSGRQDGGGVDVAEMPMSRKIGDDLQGMGKGEPGMELQR
jgi:hypothetical protein